VASLEIPDAWGLSEAEPASAAIATTIATTGSAAAPFIGPHAGLPIGAHFADKRITGTAAGITTSPTTKGSLSGGIEGVVSSPGEQIWTPTATSSTQVIHYMYAVTLHQSPQQVVCKCNIGDGV